jgi:PTS system cellobiose-specific IIB component
MLVCTTGISAAILVKRMGEEAARQKLDVEVTAVPAARLAAGAAACDVLLLGPQIRYLLEKAKAAAGAKPLAVIDKGDYGMMRGDRVLALALKLLAENNGDSGKQP